MCELAWKKKIVRKAAKQHSKLFSVYHCKAVNRALPQWSYLHSRAIQWKQTPLVSKAGNDRHVYVYVWPRPSRSAWASNIANGWFPYASLWENFQSAIAKVCIKTFSGQISSFNTFCVPICKNYCPKCSLTYWELNYLVFKSEAIVSPAQAMAEPRTSDCSVSLAKHFPLRQSRWLWRTTANRRIIQAPEALESWTAICTYKVHTG